MGQVSKQARIEAIGESGFLDRLLPNLPLHRGVLVGPGDDCAVIQSGRKKLLITTDALVEGAHFRTGWLSPRQLGRKAYLVNLSDIAAMGGTPRFCVLSAGVPHGFPVRDLMRIHRGLADAARESGAAVVGGNLTHCERLFLSVTLIGGVPGQPVTRSGGRPGDFIYVTGLLGDAALGVKLLQRDPKARGGAVRRFAEPQPRLRVGQLLSKGLASAMIDVSDGLLRDLHHLCAASRVGARLEIDRVPCSAAVRRADPMLALTGGEDYELLWTISPRRSSHMERLRQKFDCTFTRIGQLMPRSYGIRIYDGRRRVRVDRDGFDHLRGEQMR
jgi:thiamine-monophosphate kinase